MADFGMSVHVDAPLDQALERTRAALADQGFGILTEIDVDVPPQIILGACNAPLARQGLQIEPDLGLLLPCNRRERRGVRRSPPAAGSHHRSRRAAPRPSPCDP